jgi:AraC-like DNA-binding protein
MNIIDLQISPYDTKARHKIVQENIKAFCDSIRQSFKDNKRVLSLKEKQIVYENSKLANYFDPDYFRIDGVGCIMIKFLQYIKDHPASKLASDYEHMSSHSKGGQTTVENSCLLNSKINRIKGSKELHEFSLESIKNFVKKYGITPREFRKDLKDNGIDYISKKYNLLFEYNEKNQIRPVVSGATKTGKYIYAKFSENIEEAVESIDWEDDIETIIIIAIVGAVIVGAFVIVVFKFLQVKAPIWYEKLKFFIEENKRIKDYITKKSQKLEDSIKEQIRIKIEENFKNNVIPEKEKFTESCHDVGLVIYGFFINQNHLVHENKLRRLQNPRK